MKPVITDFINFLIAQEFSFFFSVFDLNVMNGFL